MDEKFNTVFERLCGVMRPFVRELDCKVDEPGRLYLDIHHIMNNNKPLFFGSAEIKRAYVSYHLMPVYVFSRLLDATGPAGEPLLR